jgi:hypothetical protein
MAPEVALLTILENITDEKTAHLAAAAHIRSSAVATARVAAPTSDELIGHRPWQQQWPGCRRRPAAAENLQQLTVALVAEEAAANSNMAVPL